MEIIVRYNNIYLKNGDLGEHFSNIKADLTVDKLGRVNVKTTKYSFSTDLNHLPLELLQDIATVLETQSYTRILKNIEKRTMQSIQKKQIEPNE